MTDSILRSYQYYSTTSMVPFPVVVPFGIDGSVHANGTGASTNAVLSTSYSDDLIIACAQCNAGPVTVSCGSLSFGLVATALYNGNTQFPITLWKAVAAAPLTSVTITATPNSASFTTIDVFGISGANTASPLDVNIVTLDGSPGVGGDPLSMTTTVNDTMIIGTFRMGATSTPTAGAAFTQLFGANFQLTEYKIVTTTQVGLSVNITTGNNDSQGGVAVAVKKA